MNLSEVNMQRPAYTKQLTRVCCREWQTVRQGAGLAAQGLITSLACTLAIGKNGWRGLSFHQNSECGVRKIALVVLGMACCGHKYSHFISWTDRYFPANNWLSIDAKQVLKIQQDLDCSQQISSSCQPFPKSSPIQKHIIVCFFKGCVLNVWNTSTYRCKLQKDDNGSDHERSPKWNLDMDPKHHLKICFYSSSLSKLFTSCISSYYQARASKWVTVDVNKTLYNQRWMLNQWADIYK